jgi:hypothetical protein
MPEGIGYPDPNNPGKMMPNPPAEGAAGAPSESSAGDELGMLSAEIDALLGGAGGGAAMGMEGGDMPADMPADDPSAMPPMQPDASPEPAAADEELQPLIDKLNLTPEKARDLMEAAATFGPTMDMDAVDLADALSRDSQLMIDLMTHATDEEMPEDDVAIFSVGGMAPPDDMDEEPDVDQGMNDEM